MVISVRKELIASAKCGLKRITGAYHVYCGQCAQGICAKCLQPRQAEQAPETVKKDDQEILERMNERQKRSYLRKVEQGDEQGMSRIIAQVEAKGNEFDDDFDDFDDEDEC